MIEGSVILDTEIQDVIDCIDSYLLNDWMPQDMDIIKELDLKKARLEALRTRLTNYKKGE